MMQRKILGLFIVIIGLVFMGCPNPEIDTPKSSNANLSSISIEFNSVPFILDPVFDPKIYSYRLKVPNELSSIELSYGSEDPNSIITGTSQGIITLTGVTTAISIHIISPDESTTKNYQINIERAGVASIDYEYIYDDGLKDMNFAPKSTVAGGELGNVFNIGLDVKKLKSVSIYASKAGTGVLNEGKLNVYSIINDNYVLRKTIQFTPVTDNSWFSIDLSGVDININGDVLVAVEWLTPTGITSPYTSFFIGGDLTGATFDRALWKVPGGTFKPSSNYVPDGAIMNLMLRLMIGNY